MLKRHYFVKFIFCLFAWVGVLSLFSTVLAQTAADTQIKNIASVTFTDGTNSFTNQSNEVVVTVAKVAGLTITPDGQINSAVVPGQTGVVTTFRVTNTGNFTDDVKFLANGTSLRVIGGATITSATVGASATDILTNPAVVTQTLAQNGFADVTVTLSINASAAAGSTIQVFLGDAASGTNFDNIAATNSVNEVSTVSTGATNGSREARGDISMTVNAPDLALMKSHVGNFSRGTSRTYTLTATNIGNIPTSGTITLTDTLPVGMTVNGGTAGVVTITGTNAANWTCNSNAVSPQVVTCTSTTAISNVAGSNTSTFNLGVFVGLNTIGSSTNNATVSVPNESTTTLANNTATDPTTVVTAIGCSAVYASASSAGRTSLYTLSGSTMSAIYTAPQTLGGLAISSNGSAYYDNGTFANPPLYQFNGTNQITTALTMPNLLVGEAADAAGNVYYIDTTYHLRRATAGGSGAATDLGALIFDAGDTIGPNIKYGDMTFDGNGRLIWYSSLNNGAGKTYLYVIDLNTLKAKNIGDVGPDGATGVAFDSAGRLVTTSATGQTVYSVNLGSSNLDGTVVGTVNPTVYDLGSCATPILNPNLTVAKSVSNITKNQAPATIAQSGDVLEYTVTVTNNGNMPSYDATLADVIPVGTTYLANSTTSNGIAVADNAGAMPYATAREIHSGAQPNGVIYGGGGTVTVKFSVTVNASGLPANIENTATATFPTVSGGVTTINSVNSNTTLTPSALVPPNLVLVKSCPSPADCTTAPQMPGTDITYKIDFTNNGGSGASNLALVDAVPANMDFKVGSATSNVGTTGLVFAIEYSSDYDPLNPTFATWTYTPISGGGTASAGYDRLVKAIRWRVTSGSLSNISPNNVGDISFVSEVLPAEDALA